MREYFGRCLPETDERPNAPRVFLSGVKCGFICGGPRRRPLKTKQFVERLTTLHYLLPPPIPPLLPTALWLLNALAMTSLQSIKFMLYKKIVWGTVHDLRQALAIFKDPVHNRDPPN